jgi:hypothetical protein
MAMLRSVLPFLGAAAFATAAQAQLNPALHDPQSQDTRYSVQNMNFDMWCQEEQHLPPNRCDKRLPEDDAAFDAYRDKVERYEVPYLQEQDRRLKLSTGILHNDPVDHPDQPSQLQDTRIPASPAPK